MDHMLERERETVMGLGSVLGLDCNPGNMVNHKPHRSNTLQYHHCHNPNRVLVRLHFAHDAVVTRSLSHHSF